LNVFGHSAWLRITAAVVRLKRSSEADFSAHLMPSMDWN